jgi:hypothetical protein
MKRDPLKDAMSRRSPLNPRESVAPVDFYTLAPNTVDKSSGIEVSENPPPDKRKSGKVDLLTNQQDDKPISQLPDSGGRARRRYTTYLRPETIKAIKWLAVDGERNDYEIVQEALDAYLRHRES